jgi:hypothetical protein
MTGEVWPALGLLAGNASSRVSVFRPCFIGAWSIRLVLRTSGGKWLPALRAGRLIDRRKSSALAEQRRTRTVIEREIRFPCVATTGLANTALAGRSDRNTFIGGVAEAVRAVPQS